MMLFVSLSVGVVLSNQRSLKFNYQVNQPIHLYEAWHRNLERLSDRPQLFSFDYNS
jgi:hypothetical protein